MNMYHTIVSPRCNYENIPKQKMAFITKQTNKKLRAAQPSNLHTYFQLNKQSQGEEREYFQTQLKKLCCEDPPLEQPQNMVPIQLTRI